MLLFLLCAYLRMGRLSEWGQKPSEQSEEWEWTREGKALEAGVLGGSLKFPGDAKEGTFITYRRQANTLHFWARSGDSE